MKNGKANMVKTVFRILMGLFLPGLCATVMAAELSLTWDPSLSANIAHYKVYYGETSGNYNSSIQIGSQTSYRVTGLQPAKHYCLAVTAINVSGVESVPSNEVCATTADDGGPIDPKPPVDATAPVISSVAVDNQSVTTDSATITWTTDEAANTRVVYGTTTAYGKESFSATLATTHSVKLSGLLSATRYYFCVKSRDAAENEATSCDHTFTTKIPEVITPPDTTAPVIGNVASSNVTAVSATITWLTNEPATATIDYGPTASYGKSSKPGGALTTTHNHTLSNLTPNTLYHYRVRSADAENNQAVSADYTFVTDPVGEVTLTIPLFAPAENTLTGSIRTGLALLNQGSTAASLAFRALDNEGALIAGTDIDNPVTITAAPHAQTPLLEDQILGAGWLRADKDGWLRVNSDSSAVSGLFLIFDEDHSFIEGARPVAAPMRDFLFADVLTSGDNRLSFINAATEAAMVQVDLMKADGTVRNSVEETVVGGGMLSVDLYEELFSDVQAVESDYVRVHSALGVHPFAFLRRETGDLAILEGLDAAGGSMTERLAPRYVFSQSARTTISIINLSPAAGAVRMRLVGNDGVQIGIENVATIPAGGKLYVKNPSIFLPQQSEFAISGYVEIVAAEGVKITGNVLFEDGNTYTAMPLTDALMPSVMFSHVAFNDKYSSRITLINPEEKAAAVKASLHAQDGTIIESTEMVIPARNRVVRSLDEYFPTLTGASMTEGYIHVAASKALATYMELSDAEALAIIQPQEGPETQVDDPIDPVTMTGIRIAPTTLHVMAGERSAAVQVYSLWSDNTEKLLTTGIVWSSSNTQIATVAAGIVTGVTAGNTTVTANYQGHSVTVQVSVQAAPVQKILTGISAKVSPFAANKTAQLTVTAIYSNGERVTLAPSDARYSSQNTSKATVSATGLIKVVGNGNCVINITYQGLRTTVEVKLKVR